MNITELDSYNLADAVKFNDELNPAIWTGTEMKPEVREQLLKIARDFQEFLGLSTLDVKDITVSGSNAGYTYTPHSDIDLHLIVDIPQADSDEVYRELFDAKKYQYNDLHDITIGGYDVELYVENANKPAVSKGLFSVLNNKWLSIPRKRRAEVDDDAVRSKFEDLGHRIEAAVAGKDADTITKLAEKIKNMRQAGLAEHGELGPENLAYKILRKQGLIKQLYDARNAARDAELSLKEKQKIKAPVVYGFTSEDLDTDGVMMTRPTNCSSEAAVPEAIPSDEKILKDFIDFVAKELKLKELPSIKLRKDPQWSVRNKTFGRYIDDKNLLEVAWGQRHIMDVLRTVAHELTHRRQHEREDVPHSAGETGSPYENEANARAGILMRDYARLHPEYFEAGQAEQLHGDEVDESVKGRLGALAAAACIAGTPGCATTQDAVKGIQTAGRTAQAVQNITRQGAKAELEQELRNYLRAKSGRSSEGNLSKIYQLEKEVTKESASGYIPTKKQAKDPRFSMALTQDIKPGQVGKEANKLGLETDRQGKPELLIKGLKNALREFKETGALPKPKSRFGYTPKTQVPGEIEDDLGNQEATGPEFAPQMPAGTTKIDVTDLTDWYRLGMDISDMDDADPEDYNQGPPQTVITFPSDEAEQAYLKQFKRLGLKTHDLDPDVEGGEDVTGKHLKEDDQLDEVKMSPGALAKFANSPEAEGIMAGFEAELIFRDTKGDDEDGDMEADMDADERPRSINDVIEFFSNDDAGYGLSPRAAERLQNRLDEAYFEWRDEQIMSDFEREADDLIREQWLEERPMVERIHSALTDGMGLDDEQADAVQRLHDQRRNKEISGSDMTEEQLEMISQYSEAKEIADSILDEEVEASLDNQDGYYDAALDEFRDNYDEDDSDFFNDMGWRWMSDIMNEFNLDWPYYYSGGGSYGDRDWDDIGVSLRNATGMQVKVGSGYHQTKRGDYYIIEPDGSLSPDDPGQEAGLEIVSPPMPLNKAIEQLNSVVAWANDPNEGNAYTNSSTGLHMGVSIPFKGGDVDYVKLALFLGDQYVLEKFGRSANTYCKSALKELRERQQSSNNRVKVDDAMTMMKSGLLELAEKYVNSYGIGQAKYTSIHIKPGYIEFRSPGGDYLAKGDEEIGILENTMRRFAYAMYLAGRPDLERKEYYKKLYKLIAPEGGKELEMFAKFSSGEITAEELKKQWAEKVIAKEVPVTGKEKGNWVLYDNSTQKPVPGMTFGNYTETDALERAKAKVSPASSMKDFKLAYTLADDSANTGKWDVVERGTEKLVDTIEAPNRGAAAEKAYDTPYEEDWYIRPHVEFAQQAKPEPKLSRRAQLAKQIAQPSDYVIMNKNDGSIVYTFRASNNTQAVDFGVTYLRDRNMDIGKYSVQRAAYGKQAFDNSRNSRQLQQRLSAANYEFVYEPTGRVLDQVDGINGIQANAVLADVRRRYDDLPADSIIARPRAPQVRDIPITIDQDRLQQAQAANGVPMWELYDRSTNNVVYTLADHNEREAQREAMAWLRSVGAEDPDTYTERFGLRAKLAELTNESVDDAQRARNAMDAAAKKMGYANFSAVPPNAKNTIMQMAVNALKLDSGHYNMLDKKKNK